MGNFIGRERERDEPNCEDLLRKYLDNPNMAMNPQYIRTVKYIKSDPITTDDLHTILTEEGEPTDLETDYHATEIKRIKDAINHSRSPKYATTYSQPLSTYAPVPEEDHVVVFTTVNGQQVGGNSYKIGRKDVRAVEQPDSGEFNRIRDELFRTQKGGDAHMYSDDDSPDFPYSSDEADMDSDNEDEDDNSFHRGSEYSSSTPDINVNGIFNTSDTSTMVHSRFD